MSVEEIVDIDGEDNDSEFTVENEEEDEFDY